MALPHRFGLVLPNLHPGPQTTEGLPSPAPGVSGVTSSSLGETLLPVASCRDPLQREAASSSSGQHP